MARRRQFRFQSVLDIEAPREAIAEIIRPEMWSVVETAIQLDTTEHVLIRHYYPDEVHGTTPALIWLEPSLDRSFPTSLDLLSRYLAEAASIPTLAVTTDRARPMTPSWITRWWCRFIEVADPGLDVDRVALGARGRTGRALIDAVLDPGIPAAVLPRVLFSIHTEGDDQSLQTLHRPSRSTDSPSVYLACSTLGNDRTEARQLSEQFLRLNVDHWLVEWPGVTPICLEALPRVPELERYIDAMVVCIRGVLQQRNETQSIYPHPEEH